VKHVGKCENFQVNDPCVLNDSTDQSSTYRPVCASNGHTYDKLRKVRCLKKTKPALEILHDGACTVPEVERIIGLNDVCKVAMDMTNELNHICGSDNVTYTNSYAFLCASKSSPKNKSLLLGYFLTISLKYI
jgi:Kazal-type serine protease inhibitor domain